MTTLPAPPAVASPAAPTSLARVPSRPRAPWTWLVASCLLLGAAVGIRLWQDGRFQREEEKGVEQIPMPLRSLPTAVGRFKATEGIDARLDPETVRYAGGLDHLVRTYTDEETGVRLLVLIIYGRADRVIEHIPDYCYSAAGYQAAGRGIDVAIPFRGPGGEPEVATFRSGEYAKMVGAAQAAREESYHAFRYKGRWSLASPLMGHNRRPVGVFKIQIQRPLAATERRDAGGTSRRGVALNPCREFLAGFLPEFEKYLAAATAKGS